MFLDVTGTQPVLKMEIGDHVLVKLPSGSSIHIEVTQDTVSVTDWDSDQVFFAEDLEHGKWRTTWPKERIN